MRRSALGVLTLLVALPFGLVAAVAGAAPATRPKGRATSRVRTPSALRRMIYLA